MDFNKKLNKQEIVAGFLAGFIAILIAVGFGFIAGFIGSALFPGRCDDNSLCGWFAKGVIFAIISVFITSFSLIYPRILKKNSK